MPKSRKPKNQKVKSFQKIDGFQPDNQAIERWERIIMINQPLILIVWAIRVVMFGSNPLWWESLMFWGGSVFGLVSQLRIFMTTHFTRKRVLITSDVFKYTRHPMYTGVVIADLSLWHANFFQLSFIVTALLMYGSMVAIAWMHEQEILAKFGPAAERYYAQTPRLFFLYPFINKGK